MRLGIPSKTLQLLGLTEHDMNVYMALLRLGTAPLRRVADEAQINRSTTYDCLKKLMEGNLVSYVDAKKHRYFTAENPERLSSLLTRSELELAETKSKVMQAIPQLQSLLHKSQHRPSVRYYEGESGVKDLLKDILLSTSKTDSRLYRVYSSAGIRDLIGHAWPSYTDERIKQRIKVRAVAIGKGGVQNPVLAERKCLPSDSHAPTYIFIYAGKTAYVAVDSYKQLFGVVIEDEAVAATQQLIFDSLWKAM